MIPLRFIVAGAAVAIAAVGTVSAIIDDKKFKKWQQEISECSNCNGKFKNGDLKYLHLSDILKGHDYPSLSAELFAEYDNKRYCSECFQKVQDLIKEKHLAVCEKYKSVEDFSANYKGKIPKIDCDEMTESCHYDYDNKSEALDELKFIAAFYGYDIIYNLSYDYTEIEESNGYIHKIWSCTGTFSKRR